MCVCLQGWEGGDGLGVTWPSWTEQPCSAVEKVWKREWRGAGGVIPAGAAGCTEQPQLVMSW